jgi:hypothetical protein
MQKIENKLNLIKKESDLQKLCCLFLELLKNQNKIIDYFAVPNGMKTGARNNYAYINSLKQQGFKSGVSDLVIIFKSHVLFVELKIGRNKASQLQQDFIANISKSLVCDGVVINDYDVFCLEVQNILDAEREVK